MLTLFKILLCSILLFSRLLYANFPTYVEVNIGETLQVESYPEITLLSKRVTCYDSTFQRIGAAEIELRIGDKNVIVPVGYENPDVMVKNARIGVECIKDYEKDFTNNRFHLTKDARLRISRADEPLMPAGSHAYPLNTPWNSGFRTQGWLTICYNINTLEGKNELKMERYHDGWDLGVWEGQLVHAVCTGIIVSPDDYPELIEKDLLYNKNEARIGPNPFLIKHPELPILYYYTHMSGLTKDFQEGEMITKGEPLGYASSRGSSGGWYHLHFSIIHIDEKIHINPFPFLSEWYAESLPHYQDFITDFQVYDYEDTLLSKDQFEEGVISEKITTSRAFRNSLPGIIHVREAVARSPYAGLNHVLFGQFAVLKSQFTSRGDIPGELWFGHTGKARLYLNGKLIYDGENKDPYHRSIQPFQWDSHMMQTRFIDGKNEIVIAIEQTNPFWSFSVRPRNRLGIKLER